MKCSTHDDLSKLALSQSIDEKDITDVLIQANEFERNKESLERKFAGKFVAYCAGQLFYGDTLEEAIANIRLSFSDRPFYAKKFPPTDTPGEGRTTESSVSSSRSGNQWSIGPTNDENNRTFDDGRNLMRT